MPFLNRYVGNRVHRGGALAACGIRVSDAYCGASEHPSPSSERPRSAIDRNGVRPRDDLQGIASRHARKRGTDRLLRAHRSRESSTGFPTLGGAFALHPALQPELALPRTGSRHVPGGFLGMLLGILPPFYATGRWSQTHTLLYLVALMIVGAQVVQMGIFARTCAMTHLGEPDKLLEWLRHRVRLGHGLLAGGLLAASGAVMLGFIASLWAIGGSPHIALRVPHGACCRAPGHRSPACVQLVPLVPSLDAAGRGCSRAARATVASPHVEELRRLTSRHKCASASSTTGSIR